jgi:hypothetical protein
MSEKIEFYETKEFKDWLENPITKSFFNNIEQAVNAKMEQTKNDLFNLPLQSSINTEVLKNTILACQAQLNLLQSYYGFKESTKESEDNAN